MGYIQHMVIIAAAAERDDCVRMFFLLYDHSAHIFRRATYGRPGALYTRLLALSPDVYLFNGFFFKTKKKENAQFCRSQSSHFFLAGNLTNRLLIIF